MALRDAVLISPSLCSIKTREDAERACESAVRLESVEASGERVRGVRRREIMFVRQLGGRPERGGSADDRREEAATDSSS
jgi:hypothetical protein